MTESEQQNVFKSWLDDHKGLLFKIVRAYAFTMEDRDDLFQEVALQVWKSIPNFRNESAVTTWLYRIALNTSLRWKSREDKIGTKSGEMDYPSLLGSPDNTNEDERVEWLYREINKLNEIDKSLCVMLLDDFSYKEMADMLGISESNVAVKIHRLKKYLAEQSKIKTAHEI
ncbi:MAG: sigma-70 family RNA polymerase sigma factor [Cyclobacteriaceae bacterium]